jgi:hypothetical protein
MNGHWSVVSGHLLQGILNLRRHFASTRSLTRQRRIVRDEAALGEPHEARESNADQRLDACTRCPSLARQASILTKAQYQNFGMVQN